MTTPASSANLAAITEPGALVWRVRSTSSSAIRPAGQPWPRLLEETLAACNAVAIFIGPEGLGPWQQRERDLALDRQTREHGFPVIPVLLGRGDSPKIGLEWT